MACEQFPPKPLILNNRDIYLFCYCVIYHQYTCRAHSPLIRPVSRIPSLVGTSVEPRCAPSRCPSSDRSRHQPTAQKPLLGYTNNEAALSGRPMPGFVTGQSAHGGSVDAPFWSGKKLPACDARGCRHLPC